MFPLYGVYLLLLSVWPTTLPLAEWPNDLDYTRLTEAQRIVFTARFIEVIAAFTLLGYMVAGMRGRKDESASENGWLGAWLIVDVFNPHRDTAGFPQWTAIFPTRSDSVYRGRSIWSTNLSVSDDGCNAHGGAGTKPMKCAEAPPLLYCRAWFFAVFTVKGFSSLHYKSVQCGW